MRQPCEAEKYGKTGTAKRECTLRPSVPAPFPPFRAQRRRNASRQWQHTRTSSPERRSSFPSTRPLAFTHAWADGPCVQDFAIVDQLLIAKGLLRFLLGGFIRPSLDLLAGASADAWYLVGGQERDQSGPYWRTGYNLAYAAGWYPE